MKQQGKWIIQAGEKVPTEKGRRAFRKNLHFGSKWKDKQYEVKQVMPIVVEEAEEIVVVTVYVFYFGG